MDNLNSPELYLNDSAMEEAFQVPVRYTPSYRILATSLFIIILTVGLIGNVFTLFAILGNKCVLRTSTNYYLASLSGANLLFIVSSNLLETICTQLIITEHPAIGDTAIFTCPLMELLQTLAIITTIFSLGFMSAERMITICPSVRFSFCGKLNSIQNSQIIITTVWCVGLLCGSLKAYLTTATKIKLISGEEYSRCIFKFNHELYKYVYLLDSFGCYFLPLFIMAVIYFILFRRRSKNLAMGILGTPHFQKRRTRETSNGSDVLLYRRGSSDSLERSSQLNWLHWNTVPLAESKCAIRKSRIRVSFLAL